MNKKIYISEWKMEGLKEIGITKEQYLKMSDKERYDTDEYLAVFGHC
jgi:hypothetical protein